MQCDSFNYGFVNFIIVTSHLLMKLQPALLSCFVCVGLAEAIAAQKVFEAKNAIVRASQAITITPNHERNVIAECQGAVTSSAPAKSSEIGQSR